MGGVRLKLVAADSDLTGNGTAPVELLAADYRAVFTHPDNTRNRFGRLSVHPWLALSPQIRLEASLYAQKLRQRTINGDAADIESCDDDDQAGLLCLESAIDDGALPLIDSSGNAISDSSDSPYGVLNRSQTGTGAWGVLAQLVDRRHLASGENILVVDFSHDCSSTDFTSSTELGSLNDSRGVDGLGRIIAQPDGTIAPVSLAASTHYTGVFASERRPLSTTLLVEAGLRWNSAHIKLDDRIGTALNGSHRFDRLNLGAAIEWRPSSAVGLRANYAESSRAPTPAELSCADKDAPCSLTNFFVSDPPLAQVVAQTLEARARGEGGPVEWQVAVYQSAIDEDIQFVASDTRGRAFFRNIGRTRRQGFEGSAIYSRGALTTRLGYAFTDATFRSPLVLNAPDNPQADDAGQIEVTPRNRLPGVPRHRATLSADHAPPGWSLGGDLQASSGLYLFGDEANSEQPTQGYLVANMRGSVRIAGALSLFAELRNVFDNHYATFGAFGTTDEVELVEVPQASNPRSLGPGAPRRLTLGLRARF